MGIVWGVLTACSIGFADLFARRIVHRHGALVAGVSMQAIAIVTSLFAVVVVASAFDTRDLLLGFASGIGMGVGMWGYLGGLQRSTATVVAPIVATLSTVIPYAYAVIRGASVSVVGVIGAAIAIFGLVVITVGRRHSSADTPSADTPSADTPSGDTRSGATPLARRPANIRVGVRWAIVSGCGYGFGLSIVLDASDAGGSWPAFGQRVTAFALIAIACRSAGGRLAPPVGARFAALAAGVLTGLSTVFYLLGLEADPTVTVVTASVFPAISVLVGRVWYHDELTPRQAAGIGVVIAGVIAVAVG